MGKLLKSRGWWAPPSQPSPPRLANSSLLPTRARVSFLQYAPAKPHKWGIKCIIIALKSIRFAMQMRFYYGKGAPGRSPRESAVHFVKQYEKSMIFVDNLYTGMELLEACEQAGSYLIGTVRKNSSWIPSIPAKMSINSNSLFMENERFILELFNARKNNNCMFFNSCHRLHEVEINGQKSTTNKLYNQNYWTVDKIDQCSNYYNLMELTSIRWPFIFFQGLSNYMLANSHSVMRMLRPVVNPQRSTSRGKVYGDLAKFILKKFGPQQPLVPETVLKTPTKTKSNCKICYQTHTKCLTTTLPPCTKCGVTVCKTHAQEIKKKYEITCQKCYIREMLIEADQ